MESEALPTMEEDIATSEATGAPNETSGSPKSLGLFVLPRELRDMIYRELVTSRNINILRATKDNTRRSFLGCAQRGHLPAEH